MDRQEFISYIHEPEKLDRESLPGIENLAERFPYCQSLQILYLLNLRMINHVMFSEQLTSTAAHIADRKRLRELIRNLQSETEEKAEKDESSFAEATEDKSVEPDIREETTERDKKKEPIIPAIEEDEEERLKRLKQIVERRLKQIELEKSEAPEPEESVLSKEELIDKFIREEPSISRPKPEFYDPVKVAKSSQTEQPGLVTETLARIHVQQGNIDKAIEIYRSLSLKFPEKSSYFAAQIKKLSTEN